jgi:hypothetical protein
MSVINGNMSDRTINEITILLGLKKLNSCGKDEFVVNDKKKKFSENLLNMDEFQMMNGSEVEKLKLEVNRLLKKYGLGVISRSKLKTLREEVKVIMWCYFKKNKLNLNQDICDFREEIIVDLMKGGDVKDVFELYGGVGMLKAG